MQLKKHWKILSLLLLSLTLSSCGLFQAKVVTVYEPIKVYAEIKARPEGLQLHVPYFYAVTDSNLNDFLEGNRFRNGGVVFYALEVRDYENLALNRTEFERYILDQQNLIKYYENQATPKPQSEKETEK